MTILIAAPVAENATTVISPAAWVAIVTRYANTDHSVFTTLKEPTADDCTAAKAIFLLKAPFELAGPLSDSIDGKGAIRGKTHVTLLNCLTKKIVFDRTIPVSSSQPPDTGDLENPAQVSWDASGTRALARYPLPLGAIGRIKRVGDSLAIAVTRDTAEPALVYHVFAHADGSAAEPIELTFVSAKDTTLTLLYSPSKPPQAGDYIEAEKQP